MEAVKYELSGGHVPAAERGIYVNKKVTIRDVAEKAGVSISTVHQALNGKRGASEATRERIQAVAEELGYQPNSNASILKRKTRYIAVVLPSEGGNNHYYYPPLWRGVRDYLSSSPDMNIECFEFSYYEKSASSAETFAQLRALLQKDGLDGILTVGHMDEFTAQEWKTLEDKGVAVVTVGSNNNRGCCIGCVQPNYVVIGRTMAELILSHIPSFGSIVLCAGNSKWLAHSLVARGFTAYMEENHATNRIYWDNTNDMSDSSYRNILSLLSKPDVAACCSVLSQSSVLLGRALEESGKAGHVFAVGSDISDENADRLKRHVLNNLIQKNPYAQGYLGAQMLVEYLALSKRPETPNLYVGSDVVFASNLCMFNSGRARTLLL